jgi:Ca2+-binding EF-hand superfamily protein
MNEFPEDREQGLDLYEFINIMKKVTKHKHPRDEFDLVSGLC